MVLTFGFLPIQFGYVVASTDKKAILMQNFVKFNATNDDIAKIVNTKELFNEPLCENTVVQKKQNKKHLK